MKSESETLTTDALVDEALALGKGLGRPLRYVQINSFYNGSTGTIMRNLHYNLMQHGIDSYIFWGRRHKSISYHEQCCATEFGVYSHGVMTRLFGKAGFYSRADTKELLRGLNEIKPDVVHLHNIHGYYINVQMLFDWLAERNNVQVRWTLHDCWAFTGHCAHFSFANCYKWREGTCDRSCPELASYPRTQARASCSWNYEHKKKTFTQLSSERMKLITPSHWLETLVKESFLAKYPVEVRNNTIDRSIFRPSRSNFREYYGIGERFMILGVASPWSERKGLGDFIQLAKGLDSSQYSIVLVGLSKRQINNLSANIIGLERTDSQQELAGIYSTADVLFNPTREDNYPTVNLEAEACGTPVITYDTGGCSETIRREDSKVVKNIEQAKDLIYRMADTYQRI